MPLRRHRSLTLSEEEEGLLADFLWLGGLGGPEDPGDPLSESEDQNIMVSQKIKTKIKLHIYANIFPLFKP